MIMQRYGFCIGVLVGYSLLPAPRSWKLPALATGGIALAAAWWYYSSPAQETFYNRFLLALSSRDYKEAYALAISPACAQLNEAEKEALQSLIAEAFEHAEREDYKDLDRLWAVLENTIA